jgi:cytochrome d ubiquinol oxidase subunit I
VILAAATIGVDAAKQHYLFEARQLQALSFVVHIPIVCFGIAFPGLVVFTEWVARRTGDELYLILARRWSKVMAAVFAAGVVTGTILSFELGILWPEFMSEFGQVFGLAFSLEGISFFVEAIFIGIYIYGWDRMSPRMHMLAGVPMVISGIAGSLMVIAVNGWMNHPGGFRVVSGKVVDVHPWSALFDNRTFWHEFVHMYLAAYMVVGFLVAGVYAWIWLRGNRERYIRVAIAIPLAAAALASPLQVVVGDWAGRDVARYQPVKLAAFEGLGTTTKSAPVHLLGWYTNGQVRFGIPVPRLLSLLAKHDPNATITGLDSVPKADQPPVNVVRIAFQTMVAIGMGLALLALVVLVSWWRRRRLPESPWFYRALVLAGPLSVVAIQAGWVTTEVGRQPWIVYRVMRTEQAVTGASGLPVGYGALVVVYVALAAALWWVLRRLAAAPLSERRPQPARPEEART